MSLKVAETATAASTKLAEATAARNRSLTRQNKALLGALEKARTELHALRLKHIEDERTIARLEADCMKYRVLLRRAGGVDPDYDQESE